MTADRPRSRRLCGPAQSRCAIFTITVCATGASRFTAALRRGSMPFDLVRGRRVALAESRRGEVRSASGAALSSLGELRRRTHRARARAGTRKCRSPHRGVAHANFRHDRRLRDEGVHDGQQRAARAFAAAIPFDVRRRRETSEERRAAVRIVQRSLMSAVARSMFVVHGTMIPTAKCSGRYASELPQRENERARSIASAHTDGEVQGSVR